MIKAATPQAINIIKIKITAKAKGIQIGANTHHQLQVITPVNFNTINIKARASKKPIPPYTATGLFSLYL